MKLSQDELLLLIDALAALQRTSRDARSLRDKIIQETVECKFDLDSTVDKRVINSTRYDEETTCARTTLQIRQSNLPEEIEFRSMSDKLLFTLYTTHYLGLDGMIKIVMGDEFFFCYTDGDLNKSQRTMPFRREINSVPSPKLNFNFDVK